MISVVLSMYLSLNSYTQVAETPLLVFRYFQLTIVKSRLREPCVPYIFLQVLYFTLMQFNHLAKTSHKRVSVVTLCAGETLRASFMVCIYVVYSVRAREFYEIE